MAFTARTPLAPTEPPKRPRPAGRCGAGAARRAPERLRRTSPWSARRAPPGLRIGGDGRRAGAAPGPVGRCAPPARTPSPLPLIRRGQVWASPARRPAWVAVSKSFWVWEVPQRRKEPLRGKPSPAEAEAEAGRERALRAARPAAGGGVVLPNPAVSAGRVEAGFVAAAPRGVGRRLAVAEAAALLDAEAGAALRPTCPTALRTARASSANWPARRSAPGPGEPVPNPRKPGTDRPRPRRGRPEVETTFAR